MSFDYNGTTTEVRVQPPTSLPLQNLSTFTFACWADPDNFGEGNNACLIASRSGSATGTGFVMWRLFTDTSGMRLTIKFATADLQRSGSGGTPIIGRGWRFCAASLNGTTAGTGIQLYLDDAEVNYGTLNDDGVGGRISDAGAPFGIGNDGGVGRTFDCRLAHVHVYSVALTLNELKQIRAYPGSITRGLLGYWPLEASGTVAGDHSGNNVPATLLSNVTFDQRRPPINGWSQGIKPAPLTAYL